jgi:hypothetical protein
MCCQGEPSDWALAVVAVALLVLGLSIAVARSAPRHWSAQDALFFPVWELKLCFCSEVPKAFVMSFGDTGDLSETRIYFEKLEKQSKVYDTWTYVHGNVLLVLPGGIDAGDAARYEAALSQLSQR